MTESIRDIIKSLEMNIVREIDRLESYTLNFSNSKRKTWFCSLKSFIKKIEAVGNEQFMSSNPYLEEITSTDQITMETLSNLIQENKLIFDLISESLLLFKQAERPLEDLLSKHDDDHIEGVKRLKSEQNLLHKLKNYLREANQLSSIHTARGYESFRTRPGTARNLGLDLKMAQTAHLGLSMNRIDTQTSVGAKSLALDREYLEEMK